MTTAWDITWAASCSSSAEQVQHSDLHQANSYQVNRYKMTFQFKLHDFTMEYFNKYNFNLIFVDSPCNDAKKKINK